MAAQAGWYDDVTVPGQLRLWDGEAWTDEVRPKQQEKRRRAVPLPLLIGATAGALVLGIVIGAAGGASDPTQSDEYLAVSKELVVAEEATAELSTESAALERDLEALTAEVDELAEQQEAVLAAEAAIVAREAAADEREGALQQRETDVQGRETAVAQRESSTGTSSRSSSGTAVQQPAAPAPAAPAPSVSYENCTAARNAGAAPVRSGDPGYGRHLDRDGDGVGCE